MIMLQSAGWEADKAEIVRHSKCRHTTNVADFTTFSLPPDHDEQAMIEFTPWLEHYISKDFAAHHTTKSRWLDLLHWQSAQLHCKSAVMTRANAISDFLLSAELQTTESSSSRRRCSLLLTILNLFYFERCVYTQYRQLELKSEPYIGYGILIIH